MKGIYSQRHKPNVVTGILQCDPAPDRNGNWACAARFNTDGFGFGVGKSKHEAQVIAYARAIRSSQKQASAA